MPDPPDPPRSGRKTPGAPGRRSGPRPVGDLVRAPGSGPGAQVPIPSSMSWSECTVYLSVVMTVAGGLWYDVLHLV